MDLYARLLGMKLTDGAKKVLKKNERRSTNMIHDKCNYTMFQATKHEFLSEEHPRSKYHKTKNDNIVHYGQLKLFLANVQFITKYWDPMVHQSPKLLYIGAAPCGWAPLFAVMFPMFELHLYDPEAFDITLQKFDRNDPLVTIPDDSNMGKIFLYKRLFTDEDASEWKTAALESDIFFVSDIRPFTYDKDNEESESVVHECMMMQEKWVRTINPRFCQLKYKLPYTQLYKDDEFLYKYLGGRVYFQSWVGALSTEARLVSSPPYQSIENNYRIYEEMMFNHNTKVRDPSVKFFNVFTNRPEPYSYLSLYGLYNDWDSTQTILVVKEYLEKVSTVYDVASEEDVALFFGEIDKTLEMANSAQRKLLGMPAKKMRLVDRRQ